MTIDKLSFSNDPNIGLYSFATDEYCLVGNIMNKEAEILQKNLNVKIIQSKISQTSLPGIFCAGNSNGIIVPEIITDRELDFLKRQKNVLVLKGNNTALGNLILVNDKGCLISEKLKSKKSEIKDFFGVRTEVSTIFGIDLVGTYAITNNKGCLTAKNITQKEQEFLEDVLKVKSGPATVNFGYSFVKSGVIANSFGLLVGSQTSGPELERISDVLGFV